MKCKYCGADLPLGSDTCPDCGKPIENQEKKLTGKTVWIAVCSILAVVLCIIIIIFVSQNSDNVQEIEPPATTVSATEESTPTEKPVVVTSEDKTSVSYKASYTVDDNELLSNASNVIAAFGSKELTNSELQIHYWMQYYNFMENYGNYAAYFGLDPTAPLDEQIDQDGLTWQHTFLAGAVDSWHVYTALCLDAEANNFTGEPYLSDYLQNLKPALENTASENGMTLDEMLKADMGSLASYDVYEQYIRSYYLGNQYFNSILDSILPADSDVENYFTEKEDDYASQGITKDTKVVDIRHILILPVSENNEQTYTDAEWEACRVKAQEILNSWLAGDATEESFAALANEKSEDPGSNSNGGLYEDVYVGQMVQAFNDWCFDEARQIGDYGLVQTNYGYHIMYFSGSRTTWFETAYDDYVNSIAMDKLEEIKSRYNLDMDYSKVCLGTLPQS